MPWIYRFVGMASLLANSAVLSTREDEAPREPIAALARTEPRDGTGAHAERRDDGLFHLRGRHGHRSVEFVVDTGASVTVLTRKDADRLGAVPLDGRPDTMLATAGGRAEMTWRRLPALEVAGRRLPAIDVAVVPAGIGKSLLGQDVLAQLGTIVIAGDRLEIAARD